MVESIQGDKVKAKEMIIELIKNYEHFDEEMERIQSELQRAKASRTDAFDNIHHVLQHLKMGIPTQINMEDRIVTIEDSCIMSVFNVL
jgi:hypothetical protein